MAEGLSTTAANSLLDTVCAAYPWVQLHTGAPGSAGTANIAGNTTRKQVTEASAASASKASSVDLVWTSVPTAETYAKQTRWSASTSGTFGFSGSVTANPVNVGDTFTVPAGSETTSFPTAS